MARFEKIKTAYQNRKMSPEQKLWKAVLALAADDAMQSKVVRSYIQNDIDRARNYFLQPTQNAYQVCLYAGYEPTYILEKMKKAILKQEEKEEKEIKGLTDDKIKHLSKV